MSKLLEQALQANRYLQPIQFILVITTNLINIRILCSRSLRSSSCTYYFLAYAIFSINYNVLVCPTQFLRGFYIDWANTRIGCKLHFYFIFVAPVQAKVMLLLAVFDRYCSSSLLKKISIRSTKKRAKISILVGSILSAIYMSPMLIIYSWDIQTKKCLPHSNIYIYIYTISQIIFYYILAPILMIIFGMLTIYNIRQQSIRVQFLRSFNRRRRIEKQLAHMLILQIIVHLIVVLPFGITYSMNALDPSTRTSDILAIRYILVMWQQCDYFISFFLYMISGSIYRQEFLRFIRSIISHQTLPNQTFTYEQKFVREEYTLIKLPSKLNNVPDENI